MDWFVLKQAVAYLEQYGKQLVYIYETWRQIYIKVIETIVRVFYLYFGWNALILRL